MSPPPDSSFSQRLQDLANPQVDGTPGPLSLFRRVANEPFVFAQRGYMLVQVRVMEPSDPDRRDPPGTMVPDPNDPVRKKVWETLTDSGCILRTVTTLLYGVQRPSGWEKKDIEIVYVDPPVNWDIFKVVEVARAAVHHVDVQLDIPPERVVTPNQILIPAKAPMAEDAGCPFGPPSSVPDPGTLKTQAPPENGSPPKKVAIVDSGYLAFGENPLDAYGVTMRQAERLPDRADWKPDGVVAWAAGILDTPDPIHKGTLAALSGHANFVAGVVAQLTSYATISVHSHNGAFSVSGDDLPTEASVIRSLLRAAEDKPDVVNLGFAFSTFGDVVSSAWDLAFAALPPDTVVVTPAGNQTSADPRYPAALSGWFPRMIGVGSKPATTKRTYRTPLNEKRVEEIRGKMGSKPFSNFGKWVMCSADGSFVHSTFLHVDMKTEDPPHEKNNFAASNWAIWSGTSFAAPQIVARIVNRMGGKDTPPAEQTSALAAWEALKKPAAPKAPPPQDPDYGYLFLD
jgi:hypothetical protein